VDLYNTELFKYSTDLDFYICNIFFWKQKLISLGINLNLPIDNYLLLKERCLDIAGREFNSGPIFPILLGLTLLAGSTKYLTTLYLILLGLFIFLSKKVTFLKKKSTINIMQILLIICPSILWISLSPSTDLISSVFWLSALFTFKKYIFYKSKILKKRKFNKPNYYFYIFSGFILLTILTRPLTILVLLTCLLWLIFEIKITHNILKQFKLEKRNKSLTLYIYKLSPILALIVIIFIIHFNLYSQYGSVSNPTHIFFWSFSPPAPIGLHQVTKTLLGQIRDNSFLSNNSLLQIIFLILKSLIILINQLIYGILSLSGIQFKFPITIDNVISLRVIAATLKALFGIIIILPSIYSLFNNLIRLNNIYLFEALNLQDPDKIYINMVQIITGLHILTCLILIPHIRYLTPVIPFLISGFLTDLDNKIPEK